MADGPEPMKAPFGKMDIRRLSMGDLPPPNACSLPPNTNQEGKLELEGMRVEFACLSAAGTYQQYSSSPGQAATEYKTNQDHFFAHPHNAESKHPVHVFGVLDGHGSQGHVVSRLVSENLPGLLQAQDNLASDPGGASRRAFDLVEDKLSESAQTDIRFSGTTCAVALLLPGDQVVVANCGDSRIVLGRFEDAAGGEEGGEGKRGDKVLKAVDLSNDHKPDLPVEKARVEAAGGEVAPLPAWPDGPSRVWLKGQRYPGLAMSRSLGDRVAHSIGVSSEPEITTHKIDAANDHVLVLASDGVWEFMESQEVVDLVSKYPNPKMACEAVCHEAVARWKQHESVCDDITVMVLFLAPKEKE